MPNRAHVLNTRMVADFCRKRIAALLPPLETAALQDYLIELVQAASPPPRSRGGLDWAQIGDATGIDASAMRGIAAELRPVFEAIARGLARRGGGRRGAVRTPSKERRAPTSRKAAAQEHSVCTGQIERLDDLKRKTGVPPRPIVEFPEPLWSDWKDPRSFSSALSLHMRRHGDTAWHLHRAVVRSGENFDRTTILSWRDGSRAPRRVESLEVLGRIERRYRLPAGYFKAKLPHKARATSGIRLHDISIAEQRRLAWHLPDDFDDRPIAEQEEILAWVRTVIVSGSTDYRRYQAAAMRQRYAVSFRNLGPLGQARPDTARAIEDPDEDETFGDEAASRTVVAPPHLEREMSELLRFKTTTLATFGYQRNGVWGEETAAQKAEHFGLMFGALAAKPTSAVRGYGVSLEALSFGMLAFPAVWDWYLQWREKRRGFYTSWEVDMMRVAAALTRADTGWMRQSPKLAERLVTIRGLVSKTDIAAARADWGQVCDAMHKHALGRAKEINRVARVHRDPFEPILPVLEASSPVGEYRKITEEIVRLMPDERLYPRAAAESARSFLLLRLGLHLGLRQKNLRQLMVCKKGGTPRTERQLTELRRGELRWSDRDAGWEVLIPSIAFKNAGSSFFGSKPFKLILPDLGGLYQRIDDYLDRHRGRLVGPAADPGTFFVKTAKQSSTDAAYDQNTFYEAWRFVIQRYGIYKPYTGRGAIKGLLPHGPHNVRDVLATHILKQTGSYEQASYAIQDTPDMVAEHYGRFLPQDKSALAAKILNQVWAEA